MHTPTVITQASGTAAPSQAKGGGTGDAFLALMAALTGGAGAPAIVPAEGSGVAVQPGAAVPPGQPAQKAAATQGLPGLANRASLAANQATAPGPQPATTQGAETPPDSLASLLAQGKSAAQKTAAASTTPTTAATLAPQNGQTAGATQTAVPSSPAGVRRDAASTTPTASVTPSTGSAQQSAAASTEPPVKPAASAQAQASNPSAPTPSSIEPATKPAPQPQGTAAADKPTGEVAAVTTTPRGVRRMTQRSVT